MAALAIVNTADTATTTPGSDVGYTITATNTGQAPLHGRHHHLGQLWPPALDDATYNGDAAATAGTLTLASDAAAETGMDR